MHYFQVNHIIEKLEIMNTVPEESRKGAQFNSMVDLKTLVDKTPVNPI